jgi:hypothetical protein
MIFAKKCTKHGRKKTLPDKFSNCVCKKSTLQRMALGFINTVLHVKDQTDNNDSGIILRIFGEMYKQSSLNYSKFPELEKKCVVVLSKLGLAPQTMCTFKNGFCYKFVEGTTFCFDGNEHLEENIIE